MISLLSSTTARNGFIPRQQLVAAPARHGGRHSSARAARSTTIGAGGGNGNSSAVKSSEGNPEDADFDFGELDTAAVLGL